MYVAIFSSIFIVLFALLILFYLDINFKLSEYVEQFEEGNKIILNKLADVRDDVDTMNVELRGEVSKIKNKMNSHNSGHVNSEKVKKDLSQWNNSIKQNEKIFKTMNSKIDSMGMFINNFDEELDDKFDEFGTKTENAFKKLRDDTDERYDGALERVGTVLEEIDDRLDRHDDYHVYIYNKYYQK